MTARDGKLAPRMTFTVMTMKKCKVLLEGMFHHAYRMFCLPHFCMAAVGILLSKVLGKNINAAHFHKNFNLAVDDYERMSKDEPITAHVTLTEIRIMLNAL